MARYVPEKNKTVKVRSTVNVIGLTPGQIAEVDDTKQVRDLISGGLLVLLVNRTEIAKPAPTPVVVEDTADTDED
jgi:hypothetical protein